jgi:hypothetical protein
MSPLDVAAELAGLAFPWAILMLLVLAAAWLWWRSGRVWVERAWIWGWIAAVGTGIATFFLEGVFGAGESVLSVVVPPLAFAVTTTAVLLTGVVRTRRGSAPKASFRPR